MRHAAGLLFKIREYLQAAELYADIGRYELMNNLTKFQARESFFLSGLLLLAHGPRNFTAIKDKLKYFSETDVLFQDSTEHQFLKNMITVIESGDMKDFAFHMYAYCSVIEVDTMTLETLEAIQKNIRK